MSELQLQARYFYHGYKLVFSTGQFFNCDIFDRTGTEVGGLLAAAATTTPELFLEDCKAAVNRLLEPPTRYVDGTSEKTKINGGRR